MARLSPWRTGAAVALTVAFAYATAAILFYVWPGAATSFLNSLFHGLDFRTLKAASPWSLSALVCTIAIMIWGFAVGALFAALHNRLNPEASHP